MDGRQTILQMKYSRLIDGIATRQGVTREEALDRFYHSDTFQMIQNGIADLHCRSDKYLLDEFCLEWEEKAEKNAPLQPPFRLQPHTSERTMKQ